MKLQNKIRKRLQEHYGVFDSYLELKYEIVITEQLLNGDYTKKHEWATYNQVVLELKNNIQDMLKVKELQYKLTESSYPNEDCIQILEDIKDVSPEMQRLYNKIKNF
jgi:hypothetical protein